MLAVDPAVGLQCLDQQGFGRRPGAAFDVDQGQVGLHGCNPGVLVAEPVAVDGQSLPQVRLGFVMPAQVSEHQPDTVEAASRLVVVVAEQPAPDLEPFAEERLRGGIITPVLKNSAQLIQADSDILV